MLLGLVRCLTRIEKSYFRIQKHHHINAYPFNSVKSVTLHKLDIIVENMVRAWLLSYTSRANFMRAIYVSQCNHFERIQSIYNITVLLWTVPYLVLCWPVFHIVLSWSTICRDSTAWGVVFKQTLIARFMGPIWGPPGSCWPQVGLM